MSRRVCPLARPAHCKPRPEPTTPSCIGPELLRCHPELPPERIDDVRFGHSLATRQVGEILAGSLALKLLHSVSAEVSLEGGMHLRRGVRLVVGERGLLLVLEGGLLR